MAIKLRNALKAFERQDTTKIDCGNGWIIELKALASCMKILTKAQADMRAKGSKTLPKKQTQLPSVSLVSGRVSEAEEDTYLLGSFEADVEFFVTNVLVGWTGLRDDDSQEVPFDHSVAMELFLENDEPGKRLYRELLAASLDTTLFVQNMNEQVAEDAKN